MLLLHPLNSFRMKRMKKNRKLFQKFLAESQRFSQNFILKRIMLMMTNS